MKMTFVRGFGRSCLVLEGEEQPDFDAYENKMLTANHIRGLLPCRIEYVENKTRFCYDVTSLLSLALFCDHRPPGVREVRRLLISVMELLQRLDEYLLPEEGVLLDPAGVFVDGEGCAQVCYCRAQKRDVRKDFLDLIEFLNARIDPLDRAAVLLGHRLQHAALSPAFDGYMLKEVLREELGDREGGQTAFEAAGQGMPSFSEAGGEVPVERQMQRGAVWEADAARERELSGQTVKPDLGGNFSGQAAKPNRAGSISEQSAKPDRAGSLPGQAAKPHRSRGLSSQTARSLKVVLVGIPVMAALILGVCLLKKGVIDLWQLAGAGFAAAAIWYGVRLIREKRRSGGQGGKKYAATAYEEDALPEGRSSFFRRSTEKELSSQEAANFHKEATHFRKEAAQSSKERPFYSEDATFFPSEAERFHEEAEEVLPAQMAGRSRVQPGVSGSPAAYAAYTTEPPERGEAVTELLSMPGQPQQAALLPDQEDGREIISVPEGDIWIGQTGGTADVHLPSRAVSRLHARIRFTGGRYELTDLNSKNGTILNGSPLAGNTAVPLSDGDRIVFADLGYVFSDPSAKNGTKNRPPSSVTKEADCGILGT